MKSNGSLSDHNRLDYKESGSRNWHYQFSFNTFLMWYYLYFISSIAYFMVADAGTRKIIKRSRKTGSLFDPRVQQSFTGDRFREEVGRVYYGFRKTIARRLEKLVSEFARRCFPNEITDSNQRLLNELTYNRAERGETFDSMFFMEWTNKNE